MPPTPGPVLGLLDQKLVGPRQGPSARGATRDQGGVRCHRVHKGVGGAGTLHAVAALVRTMAPHTRRRSWGTLLAAAVAAVAAETNEQKTQRGCTLDKNLNYHFCLPGTHGFAASKHPTWLLAPWPLRGPPWPKTTRRLVVRILPPPPPGSSQREKPDDHKPTPEPGGRPSKATGPGEQTKSRSECNLPFKEWCRLRLVIPGWAWLVPAGPGPGWSSWLVRVNLVGRWTLSWPVDVTKLYKWIGYGPRGLSQEISCRGAGRP